MCLAVPGRIIALAESDATVDFQGSRVAVCTLLTPDVHLGDWVLVHAGFAIATLDEDAARETWEYLGRGIEGLRDCGSE
jgi:hydrogenase expression/formation protein HypC